MWSCFFSRHDSPSAIRVHQVSGSLWTTASITPPFHESKARFGVLRLRGAIRPASDSHGGSPEIQICGPSLCLGAYGFKHWSLRHASLNFHQLWLRLGYMTYSPRKLASPGSWHLPLGLDKLVSWEVGILALARNSYSSSRHVGKLASPLYSPSWQLPTSRGG